MKIAAVVFALACLAAPGCFGQLTPEQKEADFNVLAALYSKYYAPYEWKKQLFGFDLLRTGPWLERVRNSKDDLDFYEVCVEYVASLEDSHEVFSVPSDFLANLNIALDIYDGKVLIDGINRTRLPEARFPFAIGDEVVSVDGIAVDRLLDGFAKYARNGNPRSTRRIAASRISVRPQSRMPHAPDVGDSAVVVIRRQSGAEETYALPWTKTGTPLRVGPVPSPKAAAAAHRTAARIDYEDPSSLDPSQPDEPRPEHEYEKALRRLQNAKVDEPHAVLGYGARNPVFSPPAGFTQRLGTAAADFFVSGTYQSAGLRIGYLRIPTYSGTSTTLTQLDREIAFFEQNTDGLVVDQMRNPGGNLCFAEAVAARLAPGGFQALGFQIRATRPWLISFYNALQDARYFGAANWVIDLYEHLFRQVNQAYSENRGLTGPLPLCGSPSFVRSGATDFAGRSIAYSKPLVVLMDEFSASAADSLPAMLQDAGRGKLFGTRSNGAGGIVLSSDAGAYSEGFTSLTVGLASRKAAISTPEYPASPYIENIAVRPDIEVDYMTRDNLLQQGRPFVAAFTDAIVAAIRAGSR